MAQETRRIDLNSASAEEIASADIDQVSQERAQDLVEYREEHGPFENWDEVKEVPGFSDRMVENLREAGAQLSGAAEEEDEEALE